MNVLLTRQISEAFETMKDIATVVGYIPRLDNKSPLMKVPKALTLTESEIKLELNWTRSPCWLVFIVTEGVVLVAGGLSLVFLHDCGS